MGLRLALALAMACAGALPSGAVEFTYTADSGKAFYKSCGPANPHPDTATCSAYAQSVIGPLVASNSRTVCPPSGVSAQDISAITLSYMRAHPEKLRQPQNRVILEAMARAYPCG
ncbi:MAG TPA: Rap1a/Tai family immunity protein [Rhizomicrobium sp.]|nr:Rap1a/Tai family immunity protein [Rhizomicrobium sp.]